MKSFLFKLNLSVQLFTVVHYTGRWKLLFPVRAVWNVQLEWNFRIWMHDYFCGICHCVFKMLLFHTAWLHLDLSCHVKTLPPLYLSLFPASPETPIPSPQQMPGQEMYKAASSPPTVLLPATDQMSRQSPDPPLWDKCAFIKKKTL